MSNDGHRRVMITGIGVFSPIGIGVDEFWESLAGRRSGIQPISMFSYTASPDNVGGEVSGFDETAARKVYLTALRKSLKLMCREIQLGVASATQALDQAGIDLATIDHERLGIDFGANLMVSTPDVLNDACLAALSGDPAVTTGNWGDRGLDKMEPLWLLRYLPNMPACHIGIYADARGPNNSITLEEASGNLAIGEAMRVLSRGAADIMIAGTTGTKLHPFKAINSALWDDLATAPDDPAARSRPFDADRTGQVIAEGSCSLILEDAEHAESRGAKIYGEVLGWGSSCVNDRQTGKAEIRQAAALAMRQALESAGVRPDQIGHINAHGLGTQKADADEAAAIHDVFGELADQIPVTAPKSYFGNSGSGCGPMETAVSILGLNHGVIPPTLNYSTPDPECKLNVVAGEALPTDNPLFIKLNFTLMGQASAVVIRGSIA